MAANSANTLKSLVCDELRILVCLAKSAEAILCKILAHETSVHVDKFIGSLHAIFAEMKDWHIVLGSELIGKTCFVQSPHYRALSNNPTDEFGQIVEKLQAIEDKAALHHREWEDRVKGNSRDASIPAHYNPHETLVELMDLVTSFSNM